MRVTLEELEKGKVPFAHIYQPEELSLEDEDARLAAPAEVRGQAVRGSSAEVRVRGSVAAQVATRCDRCLKEVTVPAAADFDVTYVPTAEDEAAGGASELQDEDLTLAVFEGDAIDVDELTREQILLALPARTLCREDCRGLCPTCGADLNGPESCACEATETDPRWAALAALKSGDK